VINRKILRSGFAGYTPYRYERVLDTPGSTGHRYFPETGHFIDFGFRDFFETHGDVPILGFPLSEEFDEACDDGVTRTVQYFERAVFEFHTGGAPVLLRLLGHHERERRYPGGQNLPAAFQPLAAPPAQGRYFPETQHHIDFGFRAFYEAQPDALFVFGFPLSEEFTETCDDNVQRTVQYFERAVFEFHGGATPVLARLLGPHERERRYPGGAGLPVQFLRRRADGSIE
jgi:hypothetical protein